MKIPITRDVQGDDIFEYMLCPKCESESLVSENESLYEDLKYYGTCTIVCKNCGAFFQTVDKNVENFYKNAEWIMLPRMR